MSEADPDIGRLRRFLAEPPEPGDEPGRIPLPSRYELREAIGEGATSTVHRAWDRELGRFVAVKILREALGAQTAVRKRFEREARAAAQVSHPHIVSVHDVGAVDGCLYLVMELVEGHPLSDLLAQSRTSDLPSMVGLLRKVAGAVSAAHEKGIVHRDLKPANILITAAGEPKVGDFGLAQVAGEEGGLTRTGTVMGTPLYMAPEQVRGRTAAIGPRTDVYALGAILYEAMTGRPPHTGESVTEIYGRIVNDDPFPPRRINAGIPRDLETVAMKALEKEPGARYASASEFAEDLRRWMEGEPVRAKPPGAAARARRWAQRHRVAVSAGLAAVLASSAWAAWTWREAGKTFRRDEDEREAGRMVELARPAIDRARQYLYRKDADYDGVLSRVEEARTLLEKAALKGPRLPVIPHLLGAAWEILGWNDRAEECWRRAIAIDPGFLPSRYRLGRLKLTRAFLSTLLAPEGGRPERLAKEGLEEIEAALAGRAGLDEPLQRETALAMAAYCKPDFDEVRRIARDAIAGFGEREGAEELLWLQGLASFGAERRDALDRAIRIRPRFPLALLMRSVEEFNGGRPEAAIEDCSAALKIDPRFAWALAQRAVARYKLGRGAEAIGDLDEALAIDPGFSVARTNRGLLRHGSGDVEGGLKDIEETLRRDPDIAIAHHHRGALREGKGDNAGAREDYDAAVRLAPNHAPAWLSRGTLRSGQGDREGALADFTRAIGLQPGLAKARVNRGNILRDLGRVSDAIEDYGAAIAADPKLLQAWVQRGHLRGKRGDIDGAVADFEQALLLMPEPGPPRSACEEMIRRLKAQQEH